MGPVKQDRPVPTSGDLQAEEDALAAGKKLKDEASRRDQQVAP